MAERIRRAPGDRPAARRRAPARRRRDHTRWLVPLLAVTAGAVVLVPQLTPVVVDATAATGTLTAAPAEPTPTAQPTPTPAPTTEPPPALAAAQGVDTLDDVVASPASVAAEGGLAVPQPPRPGRVTIMPNAAIGTAPQYRQRPDACGGGGTTPRRMVPGVVAGPGQATLDWMADARPEVLGYRVQAVSQRLVGGEQLAPVVQTAAQPEGCVPVSVTVTGLVSGEPYVFWLEEQVTSASTGVVRLVQVGTTAAVVIG
ncbi:hypothetical protein [Modestobacter versicolor]|uniref:hypothetical protein n=1 Tax=Modestobacter versicolor TaxID=429133 RepID=UPI0034DFAEAC